MKGSAALTMLWSLNRSSSKDARSRFFSLSVNLECLTKNWRCIYFQKARDFDEEGLKIVAKVEKILKGYLDLIPSRDLGIDPHQKIPDHDFFPFSVNLKCLTKNWRSMYFQKARDFDEGALKIVGNNKTNVAGYIQFWVE